ncbi:unnamed protein product [Ectocarpus sp. 4 AP-2014]
MDEVYAKGRRHLKISKLYLKGLLKRGPNIFVALAWSQAFWLILEATAGNEDSHGYVRLSSVACYALALHAGGHLLLHRYSSGRRKLSHHALEFLLDLVTDVVGFAWINVAEEMLAQVFEVRAKTTLVYAALAFAASLGAMELGSLARSLLDWPVGFEETANQFDAGSFALPTSWLVTQGVHIGLYGFFYRTAGGQGGRGGGGEEDDVVDVRLAASLFLLVYALLCSALATRVIGGTVAASAVAVGGGGGGGNAGGTGGGGSLTRSNSGGSTDSRSDLVIRAISSYGVTAAQASDAAAAASADAAGEVEAFSSSPCCGGERNTSYREGGGDGADVGPSNSTKFGDDGGEREAAPLAAAAEAAAGGEDARRDSLRRGLKAYMRLTVGMMVGWAYNLWGQVEFRQEELEFRFGPALGAAAYAALSTALGVCVMVRGADKLAGSNRRKNGDRTTAAAGGAVNDSVGGALGSRPGGGYFHVERPEEDEEETRRRDVAVQSYHARRLLVVVGGVSLVAGWAWEEAFDLALEGLLGDEADAATVVAKLSLAVAATAVVLGREVRRAGRRDAGGGGLHDHDGAGEDGGGLLEPLVPTGDTAVL